MSSSLPCQSFARICSRSNSPSPFAAINSDTLLPQLTSLHQETRPVFPNNLSSFKNIGDFLKRF